MSLFSSRLHYRSCSYIRVFFFFFNDTATTEIYTLSLHDALPIYIRGRPVVFAVTDFAFMAGSMGSVVGEKLAQAAEEADRKSTRLNSSHSQISYAVFCLKKKNKQITRANAQRRCHEIAPCMHSLL